jgi:hypothetical protein
MRAEEMCTVDSSPRPGLIIRPMGVGEVLDTGMTLARRNYRVLVLTTAWAVAPAYLVGALLALVSDLGAIDSVLLGIAEAFSSVALVIACAHLIEPTGQVHELEPGPLYRAALGRIGWIILWALLIGVLAIPLVILFPLGIFLFVRWSMSWNALIVERIGPIASLRRSWVLTSGSWWHTLGVLVVAAILYGIVAGAVGAIFGAIGAVIVVTGSGAVGTVIINLGNAVGSVFIVPFVTAIHVVLFYELRARREGFDLAARAQQFPGAQ